MNHECQHKSTFFMNFSLRIIYLVHFPCTILYGGDYPLMYGQRIRQLRKEHKMTQEALAKRLNKAKSTISQYENEINEPDIDTLSQMAQIFNVSIDFISGKSSNRSDHETQDYDYTNDPTVTGELRELLDILNSLPPDKQVDIIQQALTYAAGIKARNRSTQK